MQSERDTLKNFNRSRDGTPLPILSLTRKRSEVAEMPYKKWLTEAADEIQRLQECLKLVGAAHWVYE